MTALYAELQQFYAYQVQLLGDGDIDRWAETFAEDAVFEQEAPPGHVFAGNAPPVRAGRTAIAAAARGAVAARREGGLVRRYWIGMLDAALDGDPAAGAVSGPESGRPAYGPAGTPADEVRVRTTYRAAQIQTATAGAPRLHLSTTGRDLLVRRDGRWLVRHRVNSHDTTAGPATDRPRKDVQNG